MRHHQSTLSLFVMSLAYALAMFHRTAFAEVAEVLSDGGLYTTTSVAWIGSAFFWTYLIFQIPAGMLVDAAGVRRVAGYGCMTMAVGAGIFAWGTQPWLLALGRGLCGLGAVSIFLALLSYCGKQYGEHASSRLGRSLFIGNLGGIIAGAPLAMLLGAMSWRTTWGALAVISAIAAVVIFMSIQHVQHEESIRNALKHSVPSFLRSLKHTDVYLGMGSLAGLAGAFHAFASYGVHQYTDLFNFSPKLDGMLVSIMICGFASGAWFWGRIGENTLHRTYILRFTPIVALGLWLIVSLLAPSTVVLLASTLFLIGFFSASFGTIYLILEERTHTDAIGAVKATVNCGIALGAALAQMIQGWIPGQYAALPCAALAAIGLICSWILTLRHMPSFKKASENTSVLAIA